MYVARLNTRVKYAKYGQIRYLAFVFGLTTQGLMGYPWKDQEKCCSALMTLGQKDSQVKSWSPNLDFAQFSHRNCNGVQPKCEVKVELMFVQNSATKENSLVSLTTFWFFEPHYWSTLCAPRSSPWRNPFPAFLCPHWGGGAGCSWWPLQRWSSL